MSIGNEVIFITSFLGLAVFLILAWFSTRVTSNTLPVRISLLPPQWVEVSDATASADESDSPSVSREDENTTDVAGLDDDSSGDELELSGEDETPVDCAICVRRKRVQPDDKAIDTGCTREGGEEADASEPSSSTEPSDGPVADNGQQSCDGKLNAELKHATRYRAKGHLVLRLQYLDERMRYVHAPPTMSVLRFKRKHFAEETSIQGKYVRLIFAGRELLDYTLLVTPWTENTESAAQRQQQQRKVQRLQDYALTDGCTIHCLITNNNNMSMNSNRPGHGDPTQHGVNASPPRTGPGGEQHHAATASLLADFDVGLMEPLFAILLVSAWLLRITYCQYFDGFSTCALVVLSLFFLGAIFNSNAGNLLVTLVPSRLRRVVARRQPSGSADRASEESVDLQTGRRESLQGESLRRRQE